MNMPDLKEARKRTKDKVEILNKALNGEVTPNIPVSILKKHNNLIIIKIRV